MRWSSGADSSDVEDRRGETGGGGGFGGGGLRLGLGGIVVLLVLSLLFRRNLFTLLDSSAVGGVPATVVGDSVVSTPHEDTLVQFVTFVLDTAQATWTELLAQQGTQYQHAHLVLFRDGIKSVCGFAETASGPFYCPGDNKVYIDLGFYDELRDRFGAPGEFAEAYVLAHELGHHVQWLLGTEQRAHSSGNDASVRLELQADCLRRRLGTRSGARGHCRAGRPAGRFECRRGGGGRPLTTDGVGSRQSGELHARDVARAHGVVQAGLRYRPARCLQYVFGVRRYCR